MIMESVAMGPLYSFGRPDKMSVPVHTPPSPPDIKYENDLSPLGPYYAHYWNMAGSTMENDGMPIVTNGNYLSPYGTAPEPFFTAIRDPEIPVMDEMAWSSPCTDALFTHSRSTSYGPVADINSFTPTLDGTSWQQYPSANPMLQFQTLPTLENLANQILYTALSCSAHEFINTISSLEDQGKGQVFASVEALFDQEKRLYSRDRLFLDIHAMPLNSLAFPRIAKKANLATFMTSIFKGKNVPFIDLDQSFLDIFVPTGARLLKNEGALWLELKTQAFIHIMMTGGANKEELLNKLFPRDLQLIILRRRPEPTHLAQSEADFVSRASIRRQYLSSDADNLETLAQLPQKYIWKDFLDEVTQCVRRALENLESGKDHSLVSPTVTHDSITKATIAAHAAVSRCPPNFPALSMQNLVPTSLSTYQHLAAYSFADSPSSATSGRSFRSPAPTSASPTTPTISTVLQPSYSRNASHLANKTLSGARRTNAPLPRRPWTSDEEKALLDGLERVKGPHWSQILALYGAGGSLSEVLKDRNQVQLKDKARNLKLFFLKSGVEVPGHLKRVTGELRTRAPGQAARRERERRREEEERQRHDHEVSPIVA